MRSSEVSIGTVPVYRKLQSVIYRTPPQVSHHSTTVPRPIQTSIDYRTLSQKTIDYRIPSQLSIDNHTPSTATLDSQSSIDHRTPSTVYLSGDGLEYVGGAHSLLAIGAVRRDVAHAPDALITQSERSDL